jgi:hypothetical protein
MQAELWVSHHHRAGRGLLHDHHISWRRAYTLPSPAYADEFNPSTCELSSSSTQCLT